MPKGRVSMVNQESGELHMAGAMSGWWLMMSMAAVAVLVAVGAD